VSFKVLLVNSTVKFEFVWQGQTTSLQCTSWSPSFER